MKNKAIKNSLSATKTIRKGKRPVKLSKAAYDETIVAILDHFDKLSGLTLEEREDAESSLHGAIDFLKASYERNKGFIEANSIRGKKLKRIEACAHALANEIRSLPHDAYFAFARELAKADPDYWDIRRELVLSSKIEKSLEHPPLADAVFDNGPLLPRLVAIRKAAMAVDESYLNRKANPKVVNGKQQAVPYKTKKEAPDIMFVSLCLHLYTQYSSDTPNLSYEGAFKRYLSLFHKAAYGYKQDLSRAAKVILTQHRSNLSE